MNVWELWGTDTPWRLMARIRTGTLTGFYIQTPLPGEQPPVFQLLGPGLIPAFLQFWTPIAGHPNFPYGLDVDPD